MKRFIIALAMALLIIPAANAASAYPYPIRVTQPDGSVLTIRVHGDEYLSWITCGNSLVSKGADGYYHYASFSAEGVSSAQGARVRSTLSGDGSSVRPPQAAVQAALEKRQKASLYGSSQRVTADTKSSSSYLVLLIQFSDLSFSSDSAAANTAFSNMMNQTGYTDNGGTGSVKDYYSDNSHGMFAPIFDVVGPVTVDDVMASYSADKGVTTNGAPRLLVEACRKVDDHIDFSKYDLDGDGWIDNVFFYFAGYNMAEGVSGTIWPHQSNVSWYYNNVKLDGKQLGTYSCSSELKGTSGQEMAGIGTFCHEFGHVLGLPDFYDTDYDENGEGLALHTLSLMSYGNYNNDGKTPPYLTYEERHILGWDDGLTVLEEGTNTLSPISENKAYCCPTGHDGEYYLFESRPVSGWDLYTGTGGGMAVYHIDKSDFVLPDGSTASSKWSNNSEINIFAAHQCMDLVESVAPESSVAYTAERVFPGLHSVTELNTETTPAFTAWNGMTTGYTLSEISFDGTTGNSSLRVDVSRQICGVVSSLSGTPMSGVEITVTPAETQVTDLTTDNAAGALQLSASFTKAGSSGITVQTDAQGAFLIPVSQGSYIISAQKEGYVPYSSTVTVDVSANLNITLPTIIEGGDTVLKKYTNPPGGISFGDYSTSGWDYYAGVRFSAGELAEYVGSDISSVSFMAGNGGTGTVLEMGVKVFFDSEEVFSRTVEVPVFGAICTVDISDAGLTIPEGKSVLFAYYLYESTYTHPIVVTDINQHVSDACLYKIIPRGSWESSDWKDFTSANTVVSATISVRGKIINLAGINLISVNSEYAEGETITLQLTLNPSNPPSTVGWYVDGESSEETQITLPAGIHTLKALLTYSSGRTEWVETSILVR